MTDAAADRLPVLEIGGTHVTSAWATESGEVEIVGRLELDNAAPAQQIVDVVVAAGEQLGVDDGAAWGVAIPGPFDYDGGIGDFTGVDKFYAWHGYDVGAGLREGLRARSMHFINDADAFGVGEATAGRTRGLARSIGLTLGTGIGSAFVRDGVPVVTGPGVPRLGEVHVLTSSDGVHLEELVSRDAIRRAWQQVSGEWVEVKPIAERALAGDEAALGVFDTAYRHLAEIVGPAIAEFGAQAVVVGGSIARSFELVERFFAPRLAPGPDGAPLPVLLSQDPERSAIIGAAHWAVVREEGSASYLQ